jgi:hypothetical protein
VSRGLYSVAQIARYFGKRPQEVAAMIDRDSLPAVKLPGEKRMGRKITLHGLHGWLRKRATAGDFMTVEQLAWEIERAQESGVESEKVEEVGV